MAFTSNSQTNINRALYINGETHATPTWVEMKRARNVRKTGGKNRGNVSRRESKNNMSRGSTRDFGLTFQYVYSKATDAVFDNLRDSFENDTPYEFWDADRGGYTDAKGYRFVGEVVNLEQTDEGDENETVYDVEVVLTDAEEAGSLLEPDWYEYS